MNKVQISIRALAGLVYSLMVVAACQPLPPTEGLPSDDPSGKSQRKPKTLNVKTVLPKSPVRAKKHLVVTANPHASRAGLEILRAGGSAVDAAITIQMVLNVVEPQSSGIGGGAFLMHFASETGAIDAYDGREIAPAAATPDMFQRSDGTWMKFHEAVPGGLSVGIPGVLRMLEMAHKKHGKLPWERLFQRAIQLAEDGFNISPRLHSMVKGDRHLKKFDATTRFFFTTNGKARPVGNRLTNPALAGVFKAIARSGADAFYKGPIAKEIISAVHSSKINPGRLTLEDMAGYVAKRREPVCAPYRKWLVCGMPPPTSGGITTLQILGMLHDLNIGDLAPSSVDAIHMISEASRLAFADRNHYLADADFVDVPTLRLIDPGYLTDRAELIRKEKSMGKALPGVINKNTSFRLAPDDSAKGVSTSHLVVVDKNGNVASMTTTIENAFGSRLMVRGFLLNNELTDFAFNPFKDGKIVANSIWPGKRPRSSMSPTIVFDNTGEPVMAVGSPGGSRIIGYVIKTIIATLDWKMNIQSAVELPNFVNRNGFTEIEKGTSLTALKTELKKLGHQVRVRDMISGLHGIRITKEGIEGGVDPRREGMAVGD